MKDQEFLDVHNYEQYIKINKNGIVISKRTKNKVLKLSMLPTGYVTLVLMLKKPRRSETLYLHRMIAQCFIPNPHNKPQVNHINGIKSDNRIENLEWCTQSENNLHSSRVLNNKRNTTVIVEMNKWKVLSREDVLYIKSNTNLTLKEICNKIGYHKKWAIYDCKRGKTYKWFN